MHLNCPYNQTLSDSERRSMFLRGQSVGFTELGTPITIWTPWGPYACEPGDGGATILAS